MTDSYFADFDWKRVGKDALSLFGAMAIRTESMPSIDEENIKRAGIYGLSKFAYFSLKKKFFPEFGKSGDYASLWNYLGTVFGTNLFYVYGVDWLTDYTITFKQALPDTAIAVPLGGFLNNDLTFNY